LHQVHLVLLLHFLHVPVLLFLDHVVVQELLPRVAEGLRPHGVKAFVQAAPQQHRQGQREENHSRRVHPHLLGVGGGFFQLFGKFFGGHGVLSKVLPDENRPQTAVLEPMRKLSP